MIDKFKELEKWQQGLIVAGIILVFGLALYFGIDPANDFAFLND